jgi:beta-lactamase superfamily II metal-dependent hydrolase
VTAQPSAASAASASPASASGTTDLKVYCFSAGKADAILLYTDDSAVLIDTGNSGFGKEICAYLEEQGISTLDYLILTHFDKDHVGGAAKVLKSVTVKNVLQSDCPKDSSEYAKYTDALAAAGLTAQTVRRTLTFALDGVVYTVDPPQQTDYAQDPSNNSSLIVSVRCGAEKLLFAGDAEDARLREFLQEGNGTFDFLKVPYHGRWQTELPALLSAVQPSFAVITCSDAQREDDRTTAALTAAGAQVFLTRRGAVDAVCDGASLQVAYAD